MFIIKFCVVPQHYIRTLYTKSLLQHIASLKDFIQLVCTKYANRDNSHNLYNHMNDILES